ncbi:MAG: tRNA (N6-isopentenyl adenosine(37)-C2)-methylthiotransferase MiaB [Peptococcaceae bacterium]|nr:tRNA (N6-isopentenyl adenosine(37)-C2)-methylthiotransferase MiaB [Peptococcaceae bacterium]
MRVFLETFGCQANERDSETILGLLQTLGYEACSGPEEADLIILNTCSIREKAEQKVFSRLGTFRALKEDKPWLIIGLCGCMAQEAEMAGLIRRRCPYVDFILGTQRLHTLPLMLQNIRSGLGFQSDTEETGEIVESLPSLRAYPFKALVNITYGCNNFCTYCIVPYVRGRERSRKLEDILKESREKAAEGALELMYLGQNVNAFGKTTGESFPELLHRAQDIPGLERIRYMTSHPRDFKEDLMEAIAACPKVSRHVHLPVQSGSSRILKRMNRGYSREDYLELAEKIRSKVPEAVLTTDIIVGFPGETDEDFADTLSLVEKVGYDSAFTFMYSPRKGTPAAAMENQVPLREKKARLQELMGAQARAAAGLHEKLRGKTLRVLAESWSQGILSGRADGNQLVHCPGGREQVGTFLDVTVTDPQTWMLKGEQK